MRNANSRCRLDVSVGLQNAEAVQLIVFVVA